MIARSKMQSRPVWVALFLQIAVAAISTFYSLWTLEYWSRYTQHDHTQLFTHELIPTFIAAVSVIGLWRGCRWGWFAALAADAIMAGPALWLIWKFPTVLYRSLSFSLINVWEFAALVTLLLPAVRDHFIGRRPNEGRKWLRVIVYFVVTVAGLCILTAFPLALSSKPKGEFIQNFLFFVYEGAIAGWGASFLFVLILTLIARKFGPNRPALWLLLAALLAPCIIVTLGLIGTRFQDPWFLLFGPTVLLTRWWQTPITGTFVGGLCYLMHSWALQLDGLARDAHDS